MRPISLSFCEPAATASLLADEGAGKWVGKVGEGTGTLAERGAKAGDEGIRALAGARVPPRRRPECTVSLGGMVDGRART